MALVLRDEYKPRFYHIVFRETHLAGHQKPSTSQFLLETYKYPQFLYNLSILEDSASFNPLVQVLRIKYNLVEIYDLHLLSPGQHPHDLKHCIWESLLKFQQEGIKMMEYLSAPTI